MKQFHRLPYQPPTAHAAAARCAQPPARPARLRQVLLYATVMGAIGALLPFSSREDVDFCLQLEMHLRQEAPPLSGRRVCPQAPAFFAPRRPRFSPPGAHVFRPRAPTFCPQAPTTCFAPRRPLWLSPSAAFRRSAGRCRLPSQPRASPHCSPPGGPQPPPWPFQGQEPEGAVAQLHAHELGRSNATAGPRWLGSDQHCCLI